MNMAWPMYNNFAMELVQGETLDIFMKSRASATNRDELRFRLALFHKIADAEKFDFVTTFMAEDLPLYMSLIAKSSSPDKAAQIIFPQQVGKALTQRSATMTGDHDDADFRDNFFGVKFKKDNEKHESD